MLEEDKILIVEDKWAYSGTESDTHPEVEVDGVIKFTGKTIGRRVMGNKCIFIDMIRCEEPKVALTAEEL